LPADRGSDDGTLLALADSVADTDALGGGCRTTSRYFPKQLAGNGTAGCKDRDMSQAVQALQQMRYRGGRVFDMRRPPTVSGSAPRAAGAAAGLGSDPPGAAASRRACECGRTKPSLGLAREGRAGARWCSRCPGRPPEAVDVIHRRCACGRSLPSLALPGQTRRDARWCARCPSRPAAAVDVTSRKCACGATRPTFGLPGEGLPQARWCSRCPDRPSACVSLLKRRR